MTSSALVPDGFVEELEVADRRAAESAVVERAREISLEALD